MEFLKSFVFKVSLFFLIKIQELPELFDKIYNPYYKAPQKRLEFFDKFGQVKQEKKDYQNAKKIRNRNSERWNL